MELAIEKTDASPVTSLQPQKIDAQLLFAANMKRIRLAKSLTQEKVAEYAELHKNYISSVERGERNISICNIERIARALGVPMAELLSPPPPQE
ncbi:helix-turn-helix domain-containing protein [Janthinobacterium lividum]